MRLLLPATLIAVSAVLVGAAICTVAMPLDPVAVEAPRLAARPAPNPPPVYTPPPIERYEDIDARPLFVRGRQPLATASAAGSTAPSDFELVGVIMAGERGIALLRVKSTAVTTSVVAGDAVGGLRVAAVNATAVTLRGPAGDVLIGLAAPGSAPPSAPLVPPAATAPPPSPVPAMSPPTPAAPPSSAPAAAPLVAPPANAPPAKPVAAAPSTATPIPTPAGPGPKKPYISPDALKGAYIDPKTGEVTL